MKYILKFTFSRDLKLFELYLLFFYAHILLFLHRNYSFDKFALNNRNVHTRINY